VLASNGYRELGLFEDAAQALEEIEPEDKIRNEVLYARIDIYLAAKKWNMAAAVARHLVKVDPGNPGAWHSTTKTSGPCGIVGGCFLIFEELR
jgi:lipopolysaccharide biosynthesis regulator YciM